MNNFFINPVCTSRDAQLHISLYSINIVNVQGATAKVAGSTNWNESTKNDFTWKWNKEAEH